MAGLDYTEQVEGFIVGFLRFIRGFFATMHDVALRPKRFAQRMSAAHPGYLKPYTFLTLATFSSVTITRYALIAAAVAVGGLFKGCTQVTYVVKEPPALKEIMQLPSVETLIYVALPVVLFIILVGKAANAVLLRRVVQRHGSLAAIFLFIAGVQQLMLIPVLGGIYWLAIAKPEKLLDVTGSSGSSATIFGAVIVIGILFPAISFFRIGRAVEPVLDFRLSRPRVRAVVFAFVAFFATALSMTAIGGMAYWLAKDEIQASLTDVPMIAVTYGGPAAEGPAGQPRFSVLMRNNGPADYWLRSSVKIFVAGDEAEFIGTLAGPGVRTGLMKLPKGEVASNLIEVRGPVIVAHPASGAPWWGLTFSAVDVDGKETSIVSRVNSTDADAAGNLVRKLRGPPEPAR